MSCRIGFADANNNIQQASNSNPFPTGGASNTKTATINGGSSLSNEVDLNGHTLVGIYMPGTWQAANLTFQASNASGGTFYDVYDSAGNEFVVTAAASRCIVDIPELAPLRFIKVRSGTTGTPVTQAANRNIIFIVK